MYRESGIPGLGTVWAVPPEPESRASAIRADGCADIVLRDDELLIAGPSTRWLLARGGDGTGTVGLRFPPGRAGAALGVDPQQLRDRLVPAREILPRPLRNRGEAALRGLLTASADSTVERAVRLSGDADPARRRERFRAAALEVPRTLDLALDLADLDWTREARAAAARGEPADRLARRLGYSERQLRRRMLQAFGYGYAALRRVLRAERARRLILAGSSPATAAQLAGYADQPHLTREFRRMIGASPAQLAAGGSPLEGAGSGA